MSAQMPGAGMPAEGNMNGMSPSTLPPEVLGGLPSGAMGAGEA
jgi:hypothetical protein